MNAIRADKDPKFMKIQYMYVHAFELYHDQVSEYVLKQDLE